LRLLLDTSVFINLASKPKVIPARIRNAVDDAELRVLSVASVWEIAIKCSIGKLRLPIASEEWVRSRAARMLVEIEPIRLEHAGQVEQLPMHHRDPFDRLLIAQAAVDDYTIVTQNPTFAKYSVRLLPGWARAT
jgi:PIN domain nuclease of toxin-antitoxin system